LGGWVKGRRLNPENPSKKLLARRDRMRHQNLVTLDIIRIIDLQVADAKNRFSELMNRALSEGPQRVQRRKDAFVVMTEAEYERLIGKRMGFKEFLMQPAGLDQPDLSRDQSPMRDLDV
jgi:prevent-host-death family protein